VDDDEEESAETKAFFAEVDAGVRELCTPEHVDRKLHELLSRTGYRCQDCWICETLQPLILNWEGPRWWIGRG
jgi:hypothetical protein